MIFKLNHYYFLNQEGQESGVLMSTYLMVLCVELSPLKSHVEVLTPAPPIPVNVTLFENRVFAVVTKLMRGHTGVEWTLNPVGVVSLIEEERRNKHRGRAACAGRG